jgi:hypothetical protein
MYENNHYYMSNNYIYHFSIFKYISNKMQIYTVYLYLESALHFSGGTSTHHQERKQLCRQHLVFVTLLLLPAAIAAGSSKVASCWIYIGIYLRCTDPWILNFSICFANIRFHLKKVKIVENAFLKQIYLLEMIASLYYIAVILDKYCHSIF